MTKQDGILMAMGGAILLIGSMLSLNFPYFSKWFPILLIGGGALVWFGIQRYRWA